MGMLNGPALSWSVFWKIGTGFSQECVCCNYLSFLLLWRGFKAMLVKNLPTAWSCHHHALLWGCCSYSAEFFLSINELYVFNMTLCRWFDPFCDALQLITGYLWPFCCSFWFLRPDTSCLMCMFLTLPCCSYFTLVLRIFINKCISIV